MSWVNNKIDKPETAIQLANKAFELNSDDASSLINLSNSYRMLGDYKTANEYNFKHLSIYPNDCRQLNNIGFCFMRLGEQEKALSYFDKSISCDNTYSYPNHNKAQLYIKKKQYDKAVEELNMAKEKGHNKAVVHYDLGICYSGLNENNKAEESFLISIMNDSLSSARYDLAVLYLKSNKASEAVVHFNYYNTIIDSTNAWTYYDCASAYAVLEDLEGFQRNMEQVIKLGSPGTRESIKKEMEESSFLSSIRSSEVYKEILNKL